MMSKPVSSMYVIKIIDACTVVINKGSADGLKLGNKFLIYSLDDEPLIDPITKANLGYLENVKGIATVKHLQEKVCTIESAKFSKPTKTIRKERNPLMSSFNSSVIEETTDDKEQLPFENVLMGDYVKLI